MCAGPCGAAEAAEAADAALALVKTKKKALGGGGGGKGGDKGPAPPAARPAALDSLLTWRGSTALDRATTHRVRPRTNRPKHPSTHINTL